MWFSLASIVLKENYFELSNKIYLQKLEIAIGTKFAQPYANLFMAGLEKRIFENSRYHQFLWLRSLDDIFCIWIDGLEKLQDFFKFLYAFHPTIKFTMDYSYGTINFLDAQVSGKNSTLETDLYCKDTDTSIPCKILSQMCLQKVCTIWPSNTVKKNNFWWHVLDECLKKLETWFTNRGYNSEKVRPEIES